MTADVDVEVKANPELVRSRRTIIVGIARSAGTSVKEKSKIKIVHDHLPRTVEVYLTSEIVMLHPWHSRQVLQFRGHVNTLSQSATIEWDKEEKGNVIIA